MIIDKIMEISRRSKARVAIGIGDRRAEEIARVARSCMNTGVAADVLLVGGKDVHVPAGGRGKGRDIDIDIDIPVITSEYPERTLIRMLVDGDVDGVVRGSLGASAFLKDVRARYGRVNRIALLEAKGHQFFFAPVGIDEGWTVEEKFRIIDGGRELMERFGIKPNVAILSGGRAGDIGRNEYVDRTIADAGALISMCRARGIDASYHEILIEDTVGSNFVLAPDGVSGNLVYRTLVHLGNGQAYGAPYIGLGLKDDDVIVDTSRAGSAEEYMGAIAFASALAGMVR